MDTKAFVKVKLDQKRDQTMVSALQKGENPINGYNIVAYTGGCVIIIRNNRREKIDGLVY